MDRAGFQFVLHHVMRGFGCLKNWSLVPNSELGQFFCFFCHGSSTCHKCCQVSSTVAGLSHWALTFVYNTSSLAVTLTWFNHNSWDLLYATDNKTPVGGGWLALSGFWHEYLFIGFFFGVRMSVSITSESSSITSQLWPLFTLKNSNLSTKWLIFYIIFGTGEYGCSTFCS